MKPTIKEAKESLNQDILKKSHQKIRHRCVQMFQQKALGQDVSEYELILRDGLSKSFHKIKMEFTKYC